MLQGSFLRSILLFVTWPVEHKARFVWIMLNSFLNKMLVHNFFGSNGGPIVLTLQGFEPETCGNLKP